MNLPAPLITFDEATHTYSVGGQLLPIQGITKMIDRQLFGGEMSNLSEDFLRPYQERGTNIHKELERYHREGALVFSDEAEAFIKWKITGTPEYVVGDERIATAIDLVTDNLDLIDYKTSKEINLDKVSWQLSICAHLLEKQTGLTAKKLIVAHLYGGCELYEVERKPSDAIEALICAELSGDTYLYTLAEKSQISALFEAERAIIDIESKKKEAEEKRNALRDGLLALMDKQGVKSLKTDLLTITRVADSQRVTIDSKKLKAENPSIYEKYAKTTYVKGGVKITIHENKLGEAGV